MIKALEFWKATAWTMEKQADIQVTSKLLIFFKYCSSFHLNRCCGIQQILNLLILLGSSNCKLD